MSFEKIKSIRKAYTDTLKILLALDNKRLIHFSTFLKDNICMPDLCINDIKKNNQLLSENKNYAANWEDLNASLTSLKISMRLINDALSILIADYHRKRIETK